LLRGSVEERGEHSMIGSGKKEGKMKVNESDILYPNISIIELISLYRERRIIENGEE
jgi:hypothetical protein